MCPCNSGIHRHLGPDPVNLLSVEPYHGDPAPLFDQNIKALPLLCRKLFGILHREIIERILRGNQNRCYDKRPQDRSLPCLVNPADHMNRLMRKIFQWR